MTDTEYVQHKTGGPVMVVEDKFDTFWRCSLINASGQPTTRDVHKSALWGVRYEDLDEEGESPRPTVVQFKKED